MSAPLRPSLLPRCSSCARRVAASALRPWSPLQQQIRGKKKLSKLPHTIPVRLLKDVKAFGRKGSLVPVSAGQMRNNWFPARTAEYVTATELKELRQKDASIERDHAFVLEEIKVKGETGPEVLEIAKPKPIEVERISPQRSMELIDIFVPARMDFQKSAKDKPPQEQPAKVQPRPRGISAADVLAAASAAQAKQEVDERVGIHGSVSTIDVAAFIRDHLAVNEEGTLVTVSQEDVHFIDGTSADDATRLKFSGDYEVEIKVKGAEEGVRRKLRVIPIFRASA
ncbi:Ribosomal protein l9 RNAse h1 [Neofusicoccum parvum]|uniref:Putative ribosomal protein l9 rnase h1 protein n=1 Tax=Botryosphaeria parva (strain UCR-NP2) TaxID=1287680 RepID=R1EET1_BOTPV|nr:putative ribosomal protein l9 rnase h1 protein [Neofusicoccum parvum UCRNP2]GME64729.1 Ribosomal protein l9 RNAse h1 [Neofusicoccum parvum]